MKKVTGDFSTEIILEGDEPTVICKLGQGSECCAFLVAGSSGFACIRMNYPENISIYERLKDGTMNSKGWGGWEGCPWKEAI